MKVLALAVEFTATQMTARPPVPLVTNTLSEVVRPCASTVVAVTVLPARVKLPMGIISGRPNTIVCAPPTTLKLALDLLVR